MNNNTRLVLVRHGQTLGNLNKLYYGSTDLPLTEEGIAQIKKFADDGLYPQVKLHYSSGMLRANDTLNIIYPQSEFTTLEAFKEFDFGDFENSNYEQLKDHPIYIKWIEDESGDYCMHGGETKNNFVGRILTAYSTLLKEIDGNSAALICHGGVISIIMEKLFPNQHNFYEWQPPNGGGYVLSFDNEIINYKSIL